jgi:hypothetical protein
MLLTPQQFAVLSGDVGTRSHRKHPRRTRGPWQRNHDGSLVKHDGKLVRIPARRAHGIFTHVKPTPMTTRHAEQRMGVYMHSAARQRAFAEAA